MEVSAKLRQLRIAPRKVRVVVDQVRGMSVEKAEKHLKTVTKRAAVPVLKLIQSAAANAEHNHKLNRSDLIIKEIAVDDGVTLKRWMPRAMGRATPIRKRSSHVTVIVDVSAEAKAKARATATKKPATKKPAAKKEVTETKATADKKVKTAEAKKPAAKKPAAKKATAKKPAAKKAPAKKAAVKKAPSATAKKESAPAKKATSKKA